MNSGFAVNHCIRETPPSSPPPNAKIEREREAREREKDRERERKRETERYERRERTFVKRGTVFRLSWAFPFSSVFVGL